MFPLTAAWLEALLKCEYAWEGYLACEDDMRLCRMAVAERRGERAGGELLPRVLGRGCLGWVRESA